jgi:hypothetical protein
MGSYVSTYIGLSQGLGKTSKLVDATHLQVISDVGIGALFEMRLADSLWRL